MVIFPILTVLWYKLGGWPEIWYRARGIPYFMHGIIEPDGTPSHQILKVEIIKGENPPMYKDRGKSWAIDNENALRYHGRPYYINNFDDFLPIPMLHWERGPIKIDPKEINDAWDRSALRDMHGIGLKRPVPPILIFILAIAVIGILASAVAAYYSYNAFCGINPHACGQGPPIRG